MADLLTEVDEAMKQERLQKLWRSYGGFFIGLLVVLILGTAAKAGYEHFKAQNNIVQTDVFLEAVNLSSQEAFEAAAQALNGKSLQGVAQLHAAALAKSPEIYAQVSSNDIAFDDLARLSAINMSARGDRLIELKEIYDSSESPWKYHARLQAALISAGEENYTAARLHLKEIIQTPHMPQTLLQKAQSLDILYALKEQGEGK